MTAYSLSCSSLAIRDSAYKHHMRFLPLPERLMMMYIAWFRVYVLFRMAL